MSRIVNGLYKGCIKSGNAGDDILFLLFIHGLERALTQSGRQCTVQHEYFPPTSHNIAVIGGGSVIHPEEVSYTVHVKKHTINVVFGTGITDSPKHIMDKQALFDHTHDHVEFPINKTMRFNFNKLAMCQVGGLRGPLDVQIAQTHTPSLSCGWIYDAGLLAGTLLGRDATRIPIVTRPFIAVNVCNVGAANAIYQPGETLAQFHERIRREMAEMCNKLIHDGYHILFYHMDVGDLHRIQRVAQLIHDATHATVFEGGMSFEEILAVCECSEFTVSNRLHSAVLSLSVGTPTIHVMYGYKCYNFMESVNMRQCGIFAHEFTAEKVQDCIPVAKAARADVQSILARATAQYDTLFDQLIQPLHLTKRPHTLQYHIASTINGLFRLVETPLTT